MKHVMILILTLLGTITATGRAAYSGGGGTESEPYRIGTSADWLTLTVSSADWNKHFILTADIDFNGALVLPVGNGESRFTGRLDGKKHVLSNAVMQAPDSVFTGLFGYIGPGGRIENLGVENIHINGYYIVGGLCGSNLGTISRSYVTGTINGSADYIGGLCGFNSGTIHQSYAACTVTGNAYVGGLCGSNNGNIRKSYSTGDVTGISSVGGLCGTCLWGTVQYSYSSGTAVADQNVGGLCGYSFESTMDQTYAACAVSGNAFIGGLCGFVENSAVTDSFWDTDISGLTISDGGTGKTTSEMKRVSTFTAAGWDFVNETANGLDDIWILSEGVSYPTFVIPHVQITKCSVTAGKGISGDSIALSGLLQYAGDFASLQELKVKISCDLLSSGRAIPFAINPSSFKNGRFKGVTKDGPSTYTFAYDTNTGRFSFAAKNADLTGLCCPFNLLIYLHSAIAQATVDETVVNGVKKPCPVQLLMGAKNSLAVTKSKVTFGPKAGKDSFTVQGTFTLDGDCDKFCPLEIRLGTQTFTIPRFQFLNKKDVIYCSKAIASEGSIVDAKFDFIRCSYSISIKNTSIHQNGDVDFGICCFGTGLSGQEINIP